MAMRKKPTYFTPDGQPMTAEEVTDVAADLLLYHPAAREFSLVRLFREKIHTPGDPVTRRTIQNWFTRARRKMAAARLTGSDEIRQSLPYLYAEALERARAAGDTRTMGRILDGMARWTATTEQLKLERAAQAGPVEDPAEVVARMAGTLTTPDRESPEAGKNPQEMA